MELAFHAVRWCLIAVFAGLLLWGTGWAMYLALTLGRHDRGLTRLLWHSVFACFGLIAGWSAVALALVWFGTGRGRPFSSVLTPPVATGLAVVAACVIFRLRRASRLSKAAVLCSTAITLVLWTLYVAPASLDRRPDVWLIPVGLVMVLFVLFAPPYWSYSKQPRSTRRTDGEPKVPRP